MEQRVKDLQENGYDFSFGGLIIGGWNLFEKQTGSYIGFFWLSILISIMSMVMILIPIIGSLFWSSIIHILFLGYFTYARISMKTRPEFGDFFGAFKSIGQILLFFLFVYMLMSPLYIVESIWGTAEEGSVLIKRGFEYNFGNGIDAPNATMQVFQFIALAIYLSMFTLFSFALPLIVDQNISAWKAITYSTKIVAKKFFHFLGFYILLYLMFSFGFLVTCGFGIMIIVPWLYCVLFYAYDTIIKPNQNDLINPIHELDSFGMKVNDVNTERDESNMFDPPS